MRKKIVLRTMKKKKTNLKKKTKIENQPLKTKIFDVSNYFWPLIFRDRPPA